jgi:hypothetical protein
MPHNNIWENNRTGTDESVALYPDASKLLEVRNNHGPYANRRAIFNGDEIGAGSVEQNVVTDPNPFPDFRAARAMQHDAERTRSRRDSGKQLQYTAVEPFECTFLGFFPVSRE